MLLHLLKVAFLLLAATYQSQRSKDWEGNMKLLYRDSPNQNDNAVQLPHGTPLVKSPNANNTENSYDIISDWKLPSQEKIEEKIRKFIDPLRRAHSPVFFSTDSKGKRWLGLSKIPKTDGPLVIVGNHQFGT